MAPTSFVSIRVHSWLAILAAATALFTGRATLRAEEGFQANFEFEKASALYDATWLQVFENVKRHKISFEESLKTELRARALSDAGHRFISDYPGDPRAPRVLVWLMEAKPSYYTEFRPAADENDVAAFQQSAVRDPEAQKAGEKRFLEDVSRVAAAMASSPRPVSVEQKEGLAFVQARLALRDAFDKSETGEEVDVDALRKAVHEYLDVAPDIAGMTPEEAEAVMKQDNFRLAYGEESRRVIRRGGVVANYFYLLEQLDPQSVAEEARPFLNSRNDYTRRVATAKVASAAIRAAPVDLTFTSLDGREVDLQKLRGKPVLIEFWATWCGPCIAQIPHLKKLYEEYHPKGFEIISVSIDTAKEREHLLKLIAQNQLPWPQHFQGPEKRNDHELAARFGVRGVPASYLLDGNGRIVTVNLRGVKLEAAVRKQLGLSSG